MKVLFIATYAGSSGASHSLIGLIKSLKSKGIKPFVILPNRGPLEELLIQNEIPYKRLRMFNWVTNLESRKSPISIFQVKYTLKRIINKIQEFRIFLMIKKKKINLLHINAITASWGYRAAKLSHIPIVWHIREFLEEDLNKRFLDKEKSLKKLNKADCVIAISNSVKNKYIKIINNNNLVRIYNGIDDEHYRNIHHQIFEQKYVTLTLAGRIVPQKGHEDVICAIYKIIELGFTNVRVKFIGGEGNKIFIKQIKKLISELHLEEYIEFLGYRQDMHNVWADTDIALVCSKAEAFGRVTVEAMMAGALVIGANTEGTAEIISNKFGLLYEQGNYYSLAEQINYALKHKEEMVKLALKGQTFALKTFTAEINAQNVFNIYKKLL